MTIKAGDRVVIRAEWLAEGEAGITFIAVDDEWGGTVSVEAQVDWPLKPIQIIETRMIEGH